MNKAFLSYKIHHATVEDVPAIRQIAVFTWWTLYPSIISAEQIGYMLDSLYNENTLTKLILDKEQEFLLLAEDETPEAFAAYGSLEDYPDAFKLNKIYILPQKQYKGFGKALISKVVEIAKEEGKKFIELNVNRENPAKKFYEKLGFKIIKEVDIPIGSFWMNDFIMRLDIDSDWKP